jgi:hypothetical protein
MNVNKVTASLFAAAIALLAVVMVTATMARARARQSPEAQNAPAAGQSGSQNHSMPGMDMGDMQQDVKRNPQAAKDATAAMSGREMDMGPHMFMTDLRPEQPGDSQRAQEIVDALQPSIAKYKDYHVALADGFRIFLPNLPQEQYHFTNYRNAIVAQFTFTPERPTSLLYKKTAGGYELEGAMFTAPKRATEEELNKRVPLSMARWHKHVNICLPPKDMPAQQVDWKQFGAGSIATEDACMQANGRWLPQISGWMVHVYPFGTDPDKVWAH